MRTHCSESEPLYRRLHSGSGAVVVACAALAGALFSGPTASAQVLTYGPILGRGYTAAQTIVRWGTSGATDATNVAYRIKGAPTWQLAPGTAARDHEVILTGLNPGETYEYEVRSLATPDGATFTTCPMPGRPMDFVFYGDSRTGFGSVAGEHKKILLQVALKVPEMIFESGDIVPNGSYAQYLSEFFPAAKDLVKSTPFMAAPGNHDAISSLPANFGQVFPSPRPTGAPWQSYYSFTCGNALFLSLDSNNTGDMAQLKFLTDQLTLGRDNADIEHIFVWLHHAPFSVGSHGDSVPVQTTWVPILNQPENHKVTAVFAGHDHVYARMNDGHGIFYIVSGGAGANLYTDTGTSKATKVVSKSSFNFVAIHLAGRTMSAIAYDDTGTELDRFAVTKVGMTPDGGSPRDGGTVDGGVLDLTASSDATTSDDASGKAPDLAAPPPPSGGCSVSVVGGGAPGSALGLGTLLLVGGALLSQRRVGRRRMV